MKKVMILFCSLTIGLSCFAQLRKDHPYFQYLEEMTRLDIENAGEPLSVIMQKRDKGTDSLASVVRSMNAVRESYVLKYSASRDFTERLTALLVGHKEVADSLLPLPVTEYEKKLLSMTKKADDASLSCWLIQQKGKLAVADYYLIGVLAKNNNLSYLRAVATAGINWVITPWAFPITGWNLKNSPRLYHLDHPEVSTRIEEKK